MADKWIKENIVAGRYPEYRHADGEVDSYRLTKACLVDLEEYGEVRDDFVGQGSWTKMKRLVNEYVTAVRKSREATRAEEDAGQIPLPGLEDVKDDHVAFMREGEHIRKETLECGADDLDAVIADYTGRARALDQAVMFYIALKQHLLARGANTVRDLYKAS